MSGETIANLAYAALIAALAGLLFRLCRDDKPTEAERAAAARKRVGLTGPGLDDEHDVGPDALCLLEDLDDHLDAFVANDPEVKAGLARLFEALGPPPGSDEQEGGESA
ncbi:hypothetical protein [Streptomyces sediminimaris]|uniref:hypothetical protein n=1 Tax=Streptomyces sediminimaris TaxID=3383721 RepID=UPI00399B7345